MKAGDWVVVVVADQNFPQPRYPQAGYVVRLAQTWKSDNYFPNAGIVAWEWDDWWCQEVRPATPAEVAKAQLGGLLASL